MASIIEMKQELTDLRAQLKAETEKGYKLARNQETSFEDLQKQSDLIDQMQVREKLMDEDIRRQENEGGGRANPLKDKQAKNGGFGSVGEFLDAVRKADTPGAAYDKRLHTIRDAASGANEGTGADGGYLVPPEYADGVIDLVKGQSVLYPQARKVHIEGNRLIEVYLNENARTDGSRHGGVLAYWKGETAQYEKSKPKFGERTTNLNKLTAYCPVTEELMQDYSAMETMLADLVAREFAFKIDDAILHGTGANDQPLGILHTASGSAPSNNALVTIGKESGQAAATVVIENVLKMHNALIAQNRANAAWYINQDLELVLMQLLMPTGNIASTGESAVEKILGTMGAPIYTPPGAYGNGEAALLGRKVIPIEQCSALGTLGDIVLADMSQYLIIERTGITRQSSVHVRFDYDETMFKFSWRVGGRPDWMNKITAAKGGTARSPYVALGTRA